MDLTNIDPASFVADPNWYEAIPPAPPPGRTRHLPTHEDCSRLDIEATTGHLRKGGTLGTMPGYEERPGQLEMIRAIASAFNEREHLMIEAGTGVGKSLAYLVPAIAWAWTNDTPVVISTATRNLQSQLLSSDLPRALAILGDHAKDFRFTLLKGRTNYLCLKSVDEFFSSGYWTMSSEDQELLPEFIRFLLTTTDGDLDNYDGIDRVQLTRNSDECGKYKCPFRNQCFIYKARRKAIESHLVIVNHALTLADAASPGSGIMPLCGRVIFDEAHNLEAIATDFLSVEFSQPALSRVMKRLLRHHRECSHRVATVLAAADDYLAFLGKLLPPKSDVRRYAARLYYWKDLERLKTLQNNFERPLIELVHYLNDYCDTLEDDELQMKLESDRQELLGICNEAAFVVKGELDTHAYWIERVRQEKRKHSYIRLVAAPLSVAKDLQQLFYETKDSVILCSATLRVGNDFKYMTRRLGCNERFRSVIATSPFDYFRQSLVLAPDFLSDPSAPNSNYTIELANLLKNVFTKTNGRALVLFTSYEMMKAVAADARFPFAQAGLKLLVQGEGYSRETMTRILRDAGRDANAEPVVLFGAQSFWEGVDVIGAALSCVVIARLPFAMVGDPVIEARGEAIERAGGSAFRDYALPEAVIKFRQGFGRLIRSRADRGVVIVTDPRLVTKNYGATFRKSIPATVHTITTEEELFQRIDDFRAALTWL